MPPTRRPDGLLVAMLLLAIALVTGSRPARAALVLSSPQLAYPQVSAGIQGGVNYDYDPASGTGFFHMENVPYVLAVGGDPTDKLVVTPSVGFQMQTLDLQLDGRGSLVPGGVNMYNLMGTLTAGGTTYSGVLLNGYVTAFGSQDLTALGIAGTTFYDALVTITGGSLAKLFGPTAYLYFHVDSGSTFTGQFDRHFQGDVPSGTIMAQAAETARPGAVLPLDFQAGDPSPAPEPSTFVMVTLGATIVLCTRLRTGSAAPSPGANT
jgi:hypothetical protein